MKVHLIAIGGSAMHNIALALHHKGFEITGSDDAIFSPSKDRLKKFNLLPKKLGWHPSKITSNLDISLNGQGAPLVPIGDLHLFREYKYCVNLGGFANISIKNNGIIKAFDICPVNIVLNDICKRLFLEFDNSGSIAKKGEIIKDLLNSLNSLEFYNKKPPKSLAREWVDEFITPLLLEKYEPQDLLHTFSEHAMQIGKFLKIKSLDWWRCF